MTGKIRHISQDIDVERNLVVKYASHVPRKLRGEVSASEALNLSPSKRRP